MCKKSCDWQIDCKAIKVTIPTFGTETVKKIKIPIKTVNTVFASKISGGVKRGNQSNETRVSVAAMAGNFSRTSRKRLNRQGMVYGTRNFRELLLLSSEEISSCSMLDSCQPAGLAKLVKRILLIIDFTMQFIRCQYFEPHYLQTHASNEAQFNNMFFILYHLLVAICI